MSSFSLSGSLPPDVADALRAAVPNVIDLSEDGEQEIGNDGSVSFVALVANQKVTEYFCRDESGNRLPSFILRGQIIDGTKCYLCYIDADGNKDACHVISCDYPV
jgi:hypothetical protein